MFRTGLRSAGTWPSILGAVLAVGLVAGLGTAAARADVFTVSDVAVDATADTAAAAREQALLDGQRQAFRRLVERLALRKDLDKLPPVDDAALTNMLQDYEVVEEKTSPVRYLARLTYRFKPGPVRMLLRGAGLGFAETPSKPVLVLPVYELARAYYLWDDPNPWREAWSRLPPRDGLVPLAVPLGDLADIADISAEQAVRGVRDRLTAIARRYEAGDVLVAVARLGIDPVTNKRKLEVRISRYGTAEQRPDTVQTFPLDPGRSADEVFDEAARSVAEEVEELWKRDNLLQFDQVDRISVVVPIDFLEDWLEIARRLDNVAFINRKVLTYISLTEARVDLHFIGDVAQLRLALAQNDLVLTEEGRRQVLRLAQAAQRPVQ